MIYIENQGLQRSDVSFSSKAADGRQPFSLPVGWPAMNMADTHERSDALNAERPSAGAWWMVWVLLALYIVSYVDRQLIGMVIDPIKHDLNLTDFQMGLIAGPAFGVSYAIFGIPLGYASDRYKRRWVIVFGIVIWSAATIMSGLGRSFGALLVARSIVGFGEAALTPAAYSLIGDRFPKKRLGTALSIYAMGPKAGNAVAYWAGAIVLGIALGLSQHTYPVLGHLNPWQIALAMVGAIGLPMVLLVFTFPEPARRKAPEAAGVVDQEQGLLAFLRSNALVYTFTFLGFATMAILGGSLIWVPSFLTRHFGLTATQFGPPLGFAGLCAAASSVACGLAVDWLIRRGVPNAYIRFFTWQLAVLVPITGVAYFVPSATIFYVLFFLIQAIALPFMLYVSATIQAVVPTHLRGRMAGLFLLIATLAASGIGPMAVAMLNDYVFHDPGEVGTSLAIVGVTASIVSFVLLRLSLWHMERPGSASSVSRIA